MALYEFQYGQTLDTSKLGFGLVKGRCRRTLEKECLPCNGLLSMELEITQRLEELRTLVHRHLVLKKEWNCHHDVLSRMPEEIISEIFQHCKEEAEGHGVVEAVNEGTNGNIYTLLNLGAVCRNWRRIAWSTPQLWTCIWLWPPKHRYLLDEWISRSQGLPLSIRLRQREKDSIIFWETAVESLAGCSLLWKDVNLQVNEHVLSHLCEISTFSPLLRHFGATRTFPHNIKTFLTENPPMWSNVSAVPAPQSVVLCGYTGQQVNINWKWVTHLSVNGLSSLHCRLILEEASALISCKFDGMMDGYDDDRYSIFKDNVFTHERLQNLDYRGVDYIELLSMITLPNLQHFSYCLTDRLADPFLLPFILRSAFPLKTLGLTTFFDYDTTRQIFMAVPSITCLRFHPSVDKFDMDMSTMNEPIMSMFLEELIATLDSSMPASSLPLNTSPHFLPNLQILQIGHSPDCPGKEYSREDRFEIQIPGTTT